MGHFVSGLWGERGAGSTLFERGFLVVDGARLPLCVIYFSFLLGTVEFHLLGLMLDCGGIETGVEGKESMTMCLKRRCGEKLLRDCLINDLVANFILLFFSFSHVAGISFL